MCDWFRVPPDGTGEEVGGTNTEKEEQQPESAFQEKVRLIKLEMISEIFATESEEKHTPELVGLERA